MKKQDRKELESIQTELNDIALNLRDTTHITEIEHDAKRVDKVADRIAKILVKGSGTGKP